MLLADEMARTFVREDRLYCYKKKGVEGYDK